MTKREKLREMKLLQLEEEFSSLLIPCLEECARGRWGLFGQNERVDPEGRYWGWCQAARLKELAEEIETLRRQFGEVNDECRQFLKLCSLRGSNVLGEPKLAADFLKTLKP